MNRLISKILINLTNEGFMIYQVTPSKKQCLLQWYLENTRRVTDRSYEKLIKITQMGTDERGSVMSLLQIRCK